MKKINPVQRYLLNLVSILRSNIRDYGMYIALLVIFLVFTIMTGGTFLGAVNFTNLLNQTAYVAVLAVGMTLILVTRQIDLSVGYLGAFMGAFVVVAVEQQGQNVVLALLIGLVVALAIGFAKGFLVSKVKVPAYVVTLGSMFIFKGMLMTKTNNRTIPIVNDFLRKIGVGYLSTYKVGNFNLSAIILGVITILLILISGILRRVKENRLEIKSEDLSIYITKQVVLIGITGFIFYNLASYRGISYLLLITFVVTAIYYFLTTKTVIGRRIYAVGGNPEAAELSGISVKKTIMFVFLSMGVLSLIAGVMYVSNVQNSSPQHGLSWELYAIAACYIGGTSTQGGVGKVVNSVIGAIVIMSLRNGMALAGVSSNIEPIVTGSVLVLAVIFDIYTRNSKAIDLVGVHFAKQEFKDDYMQIKFDYKQALMNVREARKVESEDLIHFENEFTRIEGAYNNIKDKIRNAKEEQYT